MRRSRSRTDLNAHGDARQAGAAELQATSMEWPGQSSGEPAKEIANKVSDAAGNINIPTDLLRTFVAICELGSFTKAAHLFNLTQPAVSAHMRRLEAMIGADLIVKNLSGVTLTECGSEVLHHARRMLSVNDQIVGGGGQQPSLQVIRIGIPNMFAPTKLGPIMAACRANASNARLQMSCDHSFGLLRSVECGYLDVCLTMGDREELRNAVKCWSEELVWARSPDLTLGPDAIVPLVGSPNLLFPDRMAREALDRTNRRYEVVFTAFDTLARRSAAAAGVGYLPLPRLLLPFPLVAEEPGVLPPLPEIIVGIVAREDLDTSELTPLLAAFEQVARAPT